MRGLILTLLLATSAAMPAMAQDRDFGSREREPGAREAPSEQRQEAREARRAQRAERAVEQRAARQPEAQQAVETQQVERQRGERGNWEQRGSENRRAYRDAQRQSYGAPYAENGQVLSEQRDISPVRNSSILGQVLEQDRQRQGQVVVRHDRDRDRRRGGHREYHRDVNREHGELHASDPTRREHRGWHRDVARQHDRRHSSWDNGWRNNRSYDWRGYRGRYSSLYNLSNYYDPYRYGYRRFSIGVSLWPSYYSSRYWLNDPWQYRLPPAYGPYRWVRYYDDALLVNIYTGQVVDVEHNFFW